MAPAELSVLFFLQMAAILATCRLVGWAVRRWLGQPQVVGEMIAGVVLGPSLFGLLAPHLQGALFPAESKSVLYVGAQLGAGLYMFLVGMGIQPQHFRHNARSAVAVSISGMAAPMLAALALTPWLMGQSLFGAGVGTLQAMLFLGAAISITAFPVLARILQERGLERSPLGTLSLSAGAMGDAGAWIILAVVLAMIGGGAAVAVKAAVGGLAFATFMLALGPRLLAPLGRWAEREGGVGLPLLGVVMAVFMVCAFAMDAAGLHSVFGGFILGAVMPRGRLSETLRRQLEPMVVVVLVPMFFTYSGLNTQLSLLGDLRLVGVAAAILAVSVLTKGGACWAAARLTGQDNPTAMAIGALMNARGMMELIIINIGLQRGIIGPELFSMLVVMAIVTTLAASPLLEWSYGRAARARAATPGAEGVAEPGAT